MKNFRIGLMIIVTTGLVAGTAFAQAASEKDLKPYIDTLRKDIRTEKQSLVDQAMGLEAAQKSQFWTIYNAYQTELNVIGDQRVANIKKYAENFQKMTDEIADQLAGKMLDIEQQRTVLKKKYYAAFKEKMGARVAARFLQVETMLGAALELQLGAEIPILK
jgi:hypothetical protein